MEEQDEQGQRCRRADGDRWRPRSRPEGSRSSRGPPARSRRSSRPPGRRPGRAPRSPGRAGARAPMTARGRMAMPARRVWRADAARRSRRGSLRGPAGTLRREGAPASPRDRYRSPADAASPTARDSPHARARSISPWARRSKGGPVGPSTRKLSGVAATAEPEAAELLVGGLRGGAPQHAGALDAGVERGRRGARRASTDRLEPLADAIPARDQPVAGAPRRVRPRLGLRHAVRMRRATDDEQVDVVGEAGGRRGDLDGVSTGIPAAMPAAIATAMSRVLPNIDS